jgi:hypothetical protein
LLNSVVLKIDDETLMAIGGGNGQYVVSVLMNKRWHGLRNPEGDPHEKIALMVGDQRILTPLDELVDYGTVLIAASTFAEEGALDPSLTWT